MGKKHIEGGKEMDTGVGKEAHTGWEGNAYTHLIDEFKAENIKRNGVGNIIKNCKNVVINKIVIKNKDKELKTDNFLKSLSLNDKLAKEFTNYICYNCSGYNNDGKKLYIILRSLYE